MAEHAERRWILPHQQKVANLYNGDVVQIGVAVLIGANFLTNMIEKELDPMGITHVEGFAVFEMFYNIVFTVELAVNLYGHWFCEFWRSGWNVFDFVVVSIGIINMVKLPLPPSFKLLRMMRAFRVFRLFKRVESLNKIIVALVRAIPGVINAFLILGIVMSIYSILAVEFYQHMANDCHEPGKSIWKTPRGLCWGPEYFGCFSKSLFTFFQVLTGDSWSEMVARPCIWYWANASPLKAYAGGFFFVSYVLVTAFMLINVVVAVLLDGMQGGGDDDAIEDSGNGDDAKREEETDAPTIENVEKKVAKLISDRDETKNKLNSFRSEMAELKEKLALVIKRVEMSQV
jgi:hypothetical protein